jgi:hypothetical protein
MVVELFDFFCEPEETHPVIEAANAMAPLIKHKAATAIKSGENLLQVASKPCWLIGQQVESQLHAEQA